MLHELTDHIRNKHIYVITLFMFLAYIAFALISSIWSIYIETFVIDASYVGFITSFFTGVMFVCLLLIVPLIEKNDKVQLTLLAYIFLSVIYILFFFNQNFILFLILGSLAMFLTSIRRVSSGILIEKNSKRRNLSKNTGLVYSFLNFAFFISPIIAFFVVAQFGFSYVFLLSGILLVIATSILYFSHINHGGTKKSVDWNPFKNIIDFFRNKDRTLSYFLGASVGFWWTLVYTFIPLYALKFVSETTLGVFLAIVAVPLFTLEFNFSKKAGEIGYKKYFFLGYIIAGICAFLAFAFFKVWIVLFVMVLASIGLAMLESTTESYFFDISKHKDDQRFYSIYNTNLPFGAFIGQMGTALILLYFDFRFMFLFYGLIMLLFALFSLYVKNIVEKKMKNTMR